MSAELPPARSPVLAAPEAARFSVATWSIRNPWPTLLCFLALCLAGLWSFSQLKVQNFPDLDLPTITAWVAVPGASPPLLEAEVAKKVEDAMAPLAGVKHLYTSVLEGGVAVTAEFRLGKDIQTAMDEVRDAISLIRADLPAQSLEPVVRKLNITGIPILSFTASSDRLDELQLSTLVDQQVLRALVSLPGVGEATRVGGLDRQLRVELDALRLSSLGITALEVNARLRQMQLESPAGRSLAAGGEQLARTVTGVSSASELAAMNLVLSGGRQVRLDQVATVRDGHAERSSMALLNGKPAVAFEISRARGASELEVRDKVEAELARLASQHPGLRFDKVFDQVEPVERNYRGAMTALLEGALLAVVAVWLFLRDGRAVVVSAVALPLSILPTFIGLQAFGFTLNLVTLLSLSLVVGMLVDDAIVEVENIMRHLRQGKTPYEAAMEAVQEIGLAVIATTLTLVAVFLPTAFMGGVPGLFFRQFGWTASIAVLASLLVARLLTPLLAAYLLKPPKGPQVHEEQRRWIRGSLRATAWCLAHRRLTLLGALAVLLASVGLALLLPTGFMPPADNGYTQVRLELPPGSRLEDTHAAVKQAQQLLAEQPHIERVYTSIGAGATGSDPFWGGGIFEVRRAAMTITLVPPNQRSGVSVQAIEAQLRQRLRALPGVRTKVGSGATGQRYMMSLTSDDPQALSNAAQAVVRELRQLPGLGNISTSAQVTRKELVIRPNFAAVAELGVDTRAMAEALRVATSGDYDQALAHLNLDQRQVPVMVRLPESQIRELDTLQSLTVPGRQGVPVQLGQVADFSWEAAPARIDRLDRQRTINIDIEVGSVPMGELAQALNNMPAMRDLPPSVQRVNLGDAEAMSELFASFGIAVVMGLLAIYGVLVMLFGRPLQPITLLVALPLSGVGAFAALLATGGWLALPSLLGLIMLMGITTKNSILLVDYALMAQAQGMPRTEALLDACAKRARPIVMTTLAMAAGMLPIALGLGPDAAFRQSMAVAVIGGLVSSTFLSLVVVPVFYTLMDDLATWWQRRRA